MQLYATIIVRRKLWWQMYQTIIGNLHSNKIQSDLIIVKDCETNPSNTPGVLPKLNIISTSGENTIIDIDAFGI